MIADFERRLADILGARLPAPFTGRVDVPPGDLAGDGPAILVGATHVEAVEPQIGSQRPETVPGVEDPRRVLCLACDVNLHVSPAPAQGRRQQMQAVDALMYTLDAPDFRSGRALTGPADPGFLIQALRVVVGNVALDPAEATALPVSVTLRADGWFWPVGVPGQAGIAIGEIRIRGVTLPLEISPARPLLIAGGVATDLTVRVGAVGTFRLPTPVLPPLPFGALAFMLREPGVLTPTVSTAVQTHWVELPPSLDLSQGNVGVAVRANTGRFFWANANDDTPLVKIAIYDPQPGGRELTLNGTPVMQVTQAGETHLPATILAGTLFTYQAPLFASSLFLTIDLSDLTLGYAR